MAYHLIGNDAAVVLTIGGVANGSTQDWSTNNTALVSFTLTGHNMGVDIDDDLETVQVAGVGTTRRKHRAKRAGTTISIQNYVSSDGLAYVTSLGYYALFEIKALSSMASYISYQGILTRWGHSVGDEEQREPIVITCDAETG